MPIFGRKCVQTLSVFSPYIWASSYSSLTIHLLEPPPGSLSSSNLIISWAWISLCPFHVSVYVQKTVSYLFWSPLHLAFLLLWAKLIPGYFVQKPGNDRIANNLHRFWLLFWASLALPTPSHGRTVKKSNSRVAVPFNLTVSVTQTFPPIKTDF